MRYIVVVAVGIYLLGAVVAIAQDSKVNFSGEWVLNADKSEQGGGGGRGGRRGGRMSSKMIVTQEDNKLVVEAFRQNRDGDEVSTVSTYTLDGKECENETNFGTSVSVAEWSKDGKILTISSTMTMSRGDREFTIDSTEEWSMEEGTLVIEATRTTPRGDMTSKAVYDKAEQ